MFEKKMLVLLVLLDVHKIRHHPHWPTKWRSWQCVCVCVCLVGLQEGTQEALEEKRGENTIYFMPIFTEVSSCWLPTASQAGAFVYLNFSKGFVSPAPATGSTVVRVLRLCFILSRQFFAGTSRLGRVFIRRGSVKPSKHSNRPHTHFITLLHQNQLLYLYHRTFGPA